MHYQSKHSFCKHSRCTDHELYALRPRVGPFRCNGALLLLLPFGMSSMTIELLVHAAPTASARYPETSTVAKKTAPKVTHLPD